MTSPRARPILLALLGVLAVAVAAATLNSAVAVDGIGFGTGDGFDDGPDAPAGPNGSMPPGFVAGDGGGLSFPALCVPFLSDPRFLAAAGLFVVGSGYLLYQWKGPYVPLGAAFVLGPPAMLVYVLLAECADGGLEQPAAMPGAANESGRLPPGLGDGGGGGAGLSAPSLLLLGALGVALLAAVALLFVTSDDQVSEEPAESEPEPQPDPAAIGRAAGRAADRIEEDADLENEVYRAWFEMTTHLDVPNPEASSPGEFADAAVDAGMSHDDVSRLTRLFEEVRYGAADATSERERRAVDALRRIEDAYAEDEL